MGFDPPPKPDHQPDRPAARGYMAPDRPLTRPENREPPKPVDRPKHVDAPKHLNVPEPPNAGKRLVDDFGERTAGEVILHTATIAADILAPGAALGTAVQYARFTTGVVKALASLNAGRGLTFPIPVAEVGSGYTLNIQFRLCEEDPPPFPSLGPQVSWNLAEVPVPAVLLVDGVERARFAAVTGDEPADPRTDRGYDIEALVRFAAERADATGDVGSESWAPLVVAYLRPHQRTGLMVVKPREGRPYMPLWFAVPSPRMGRPGRDSRDRSGGTR